MRDPINIIREIKTIKAERLLTPAYKAMRVQSLEEELAAAQEQLMLDLRPMAGGEPPAQPPEKVPAGKK